jgi:hypothetical protein
MHGNNPGCAYTTPLRDFNPARHHASSNDQALLGLDIANELVRFFTDVCRRRKQEVKGGHISVVTPDTRPVSAGRGLYIGQVIWRFVHRLVIQNVPPQNTEA